MEIVCEKCMAKNTFAEKEVADGATEISCEHCGEMIPLPTGEQAGQQQPAEEGKKGDDDGERGDEQQAMSGERDRHDDGKTQDEQQAMSGERDGHDDGKTQDEQQDMIAERGEDSLLFDTNTIREVTSKPAADDNIEDSGIVDVVKLLATAKSAPGDGGQLKRDDSALLGAKPPAIGRLGAAEKETKKKEKGSNTKVAILGGAIVVAAAMVAAAMILKPQLQQTAAPAPTEPAEQIATVAGEAEEQQAQAEQAPPEQAQQAAPAKDEEETESRKVKRSRRRESDTAAAAGDKSRSAGSQPVSETEPEPGQAGKTTAATEPAEEKTDEPPARKASTGNESLDDLLADALTGKTKIGPIETKPETETKTATKTAAASGPERKLPKKPSREQVLDTLRMVQPKVSACAKGQKGTAMAAIKVGSDGRVKSVKISNVEGPVATCIAGAVRQAKFPEFSDKEFSVSFPFRL